MSADGIRAAQWIGRVQPQKASVLAAELRNAVTPAACVAQEIDEAGWAGHSVGIKDTVRHILALADALQGPRPELPTVPEVKP